MVSKHIFIPVLMTENIQRNFIQAQVTLADTLVFSQMHEHIPFSSENRSTCYCV